MPFRVYILLFLADIASKLGLGLAVAAFKGLGKPLRVVGVLVGFCFGFGCFSFVFKIFFCFFRRILFRSLYFNINSIFFTYNLVIKGKKLSKAAQIFSISLTYVLGRGFTSLAAASNLLLGRKVSVTAKSGFKGCLLLNKRLIVFGFSPYLSFLEMFSVIIIIAYI